MDSARDIISGRTLVEPRILVPNIGKVSRSKLKQYTGPDAAFNEKRASGCKFPCVVPLTLLPDGAHMILRPSDCKFENVPACDSRVQNPSIADSNKLPCAVRLRIIAKEVGRGVNGSALLRLLNRLQNPMPNFTENCNAI